MCQQVHGMCVTLDQMCTQFFYTVRYYVCYIRSDVYTVLLHSDLLCVLR